MKKRKKAPPLPTLPATRVLLSPVPSPLGPLSRERWTGRSEGENPLVFAITLPLFPQGETSVFFTRLRENYLSFLTKKAQEKRDGVWFGGMDFTVEENTVTLLSAFSPFEEKRFLPVAKIRLSPEGDVEKVKQKKK